jgi:hypothetical protein
MPYVKKSDRQPAAEEEQNVSEMQTQEPPATILVGFKSRLETVTNVRDGGVDKDGKTVQIGDKQVYLGGSYAQVQTEDPTRADYLSVEALTDLWQDGSIELDPADLKAHTAPDAAEWGWHEFAAVLEVDGDVVANNVLVQRLAKGLSARSKRSIRMGLMSYKGAISDRIRASINAKVADTPAETAVTDEGEDLYDSQ